MAESINPEMCVNSSRKDSGSDDTRFEEIILKGIVRPDGFERGWDIWL